MPTLDAWFGDKNQFLDTEETGRTSALAFSHSVGSTLHLSHILKDEISPLRSQQKMAGSGLFMAIFNKSQGALINNRMQLGMITTQNSGK